MSEIVMPDISGPGTAMREASRSDIKSMPWLPQLPENWAIELHDRIEAFEQSLVARNLNDSDYELGTAKHPDEVVRLGYPTKIGTIFTAEHATSPVRKKTGQRGFPDYGTAGLAAVLAGNYGQALIMTGDQTSNVPLDPNHPLKQKLAPLVPTMDGFFALHGMENGKFLDPADRTEIQAIIGLGRNPTEAEHAQAELMVKAAADLGLYAIIGNDHRFYAQLADTMELRMEDDDPTVPFTNQLAALRETSSTNFVRDLLRDQSVQRPAVQVEIAPFLRLRPMEIDSRDPVSEIIGTALGYKLIEAFVKLEPTPANV